MEATEIGEKLREAAEEEREAAAEAREEIQEEREKHEREEKFRTRTAIIVSGLAMLLALAAIRGEEAQTEMINYNVFVTDLWAFYQSRSIRQTSTAVAAAQLEVELAGLGETSDPARREVIQKNVDQMKAQIATFDSNPFPGAKKEKSRIAGDGKKEISATANYWEKKRDYWSAKLPNFHYSEALLQIAIVLGSVAIVARSRALVGLALIVGAVSMLLVLNGEFLFVKLFEIHTPYEDPTCWELTPMWRSLRHCLAAAKG